VAGRSGDGTNTPPLPLLCALGTRAGDTEARAAASVGGVERGPVLGGAGSAPWARGESSRPAAGSSCLQR